MLRSPISYFGGKKEHLSVLLPLIPPHEIFVEVFGGSASLLFAKEPKGVEVYNDIDSDLVNFFKVLRDEEKFERFYRLVSLTPCSRQEYYECRDTYKEPEDDVERARRFFVAIRQSFGSTLGAGWSFNLLKARGMSSAVSRWLSAIEGLPEVHQRLMRVLIENDDFRNIIPRYDSERTFFYLDPPYVPSTRKSGKYQYEMSVNDHRELVAILLKVKGKVMLSGYENEIYKPLENAGWKKIQYKVRCKADGKNTEPRIETLWLNYEPKLKGELPKLLTKIDTCTRTLF